MNSLNTYIKDPLRIGFGIIRRLAPLFKDDESYLKILFYLRMHKRLNLKQPKTYSEKLQWLKLNNHRPEYSIMVDKYAVKDYVTKIIGERYIIPTLGVWDRPEDIDWDSLPNKFVLKTTHGGGSVGVVICRDKNSFEKEKAIKKLRRSMKQDVYMELREWPYKNVSPKVIAEEYIMDDSVYNQGGLSDYKFTCFNGDVDNVMVCVDRASGTPKFYFYDKQWNLLPLNVRGKNTNKDFKLPKPQCMDEMFEIARELSEGIPFLRVDLYCVNNQPYFGELTFFPASGFDSNILPETEEYFGSKINLSKIG